MVTISRLPASRPPAKDRAKRQILTIIACFIGIYIVTTPFDSSSDGDQQSPSPSSSSSTYLRGGEDQRQQEPFNYSDMNNNGPRGSPPLTNNDDYRISNAILSAKQDVKSAENNIVNSQLGELGNAMKREESHVKEHLESVLKTKGVPSSTAERIEREVEGRLEEVMEKELIGRAEEIERGMEGGIEQVVRGEGEEMRGVDEIERDVGRVEGDMIRDMEVEIGQLEKKLEGDVGFIAKDIETQVLKNELGIDLEKEGVTMEGRSWGEEEVKEKFTVIEEEEEEEEIATDDDNADNETSGDENPDDDDENSNIAKNELEEEDDDDENSKITSKEQYPIDEKNDDEISEITSNEQYPIEEEEDDDENSKITSNEQYPIDEKNDDDENSEITNNEQYPIEEEEDDDENSQIPGNNQYPTDEKNDDDDENSKITNNEQYPIDEKNDDDDSTKDKTDDDDNYKHSLASNDTPPMIPRNNDSFDEKTPEQLQEEEEELSSAISDAKMDVEEAEEQFISKNMPTLNSAISKQEQKLKTHLKSVAATEGVDEDTMAELEKEVDERLEIKVADSFIAKAETIKREKDEEIDLVVMEDRNVLPGVEEIQKDVGRMEGFFVQDMEKEINQAEKDVEKEIETIAKDIEMDVLGEKLGIDVVKEVGRVSSKDGQEVDLSEPIDTSDMANQDVSQFAEYSESNGWEFKDPIKDAKGENNGVDPDMKKKEKDQNSDENSEIKEFKTKQANINFEIDDDVDLTEEDVKNKTKDKADDLKKKLEKVANDNIEKIVEKQEKTTITKDSSNKYNDKEQTDLNSEKGPLDTADDVNDSFSISGKSPTIPKDDPQSAPDDKSSLADEWEDSFNVSGKPPQKTTLPKKSREEWKEELLKKRQERMDSITHHTSTKETKDKPPKKKGDITTDVTTTSIKAKKPSSATTTTTKTKMTEQIGDETEKTSLKIKDKTPKIERKETVKKEKEAIKETKMTTVTTKNKETPEVSLVERKEDKLDVKGAADDDLLEETVKDE